MLASDGGRRKADGAAGPAVRAASGVRGRAAQATREAILRAATQVFAKHGFAGGRVEQISKAAGSYDSTRALHDAVLAHGSPAARHLRTLLTR